MGKRGKRLLPGKCYINNLKLEVALSALNCYIGILNIKHITSLTESHTVQTHVNK